MLAPVTHCLRLDPKRARRKNPCQRHDSTRAPNGGGEKEKKRSSFQEQIRTVTRRLSKCQCQCYTYHPHIPPFLGFPYKRALYYISLRMKSVSLFRELCPHLRGTAVEKFLRVDPTPTLPPPMFVHAVVHARSFISQPGPSAPAVTACTHHSDLLFLFLLLTTRRSWPVCRPRLGTANAQCFHLHCDLSGAEDLVVLEPSVIHPFLLGGSQVRRPWDCSRAPDGSRC